MLVLMSTTMAAFNKSLVAGWSYSHWCVRLSYPERRRHIDMITRIHVQPFLDHVCHMWKRAVLLERFTGHTLLNDSLCTVWHLRVSWWHWHWGPVEEVRWEIFLKWYKNKMVAIQHFKPQRWAICTHRCSCILLLLITCQCHLIYSTTSNFVFCNFQMLKIIAKRVSLKYANILKFIKKLFSKIFFILIPDWKNWRWGKFLTFKLLNSISFVYSNKKKT